VQDGLIRWPPIVAQRPVSSSCWAIDSLSVMQPDYGWRQRCDGCGFARHLAVLGGGGATSLGDFEEFAQQPCSRCKGTSWTTTKNDSDEP